MKKTNARSAVACIFLLLSSLVGVVASQGRGRAAIQPPNDRQLAPAFRLLDASGKAVRLSDYRGKVVLLDFWATDCGGCKIEIPWYMEFARTYQGKGLAVVGVSMDILYENLKNAQEAWARVEPFAREQRINYPILMGDDQVTKAFGIKALPATYLIDENGRIATEYIGVLADRYDVEQNIKALLIEPQTR
jgi:peroxiredoxin